MLRYSSGQRGQTVNLLLHGYIGSNPILSTIYFGNHVAKINCFVRCMRTVGEEILTEKPNNMRLSLTPEGCILLIKADVASTSSCVAT